MAEVGGEEGTIRLVWEVQVALVVSGVLWRRWRESGLWVSVWGLFVRLSV